jgi:hypothetical protein
MEVMREESIMTPVDEILFEAWALLYYEQPRDSLLVR